MNKEESTNNEEGVDGASKINEKRKRDPPKKGEDTSKSKVLETTENRDTFREGEMCKNEEPHTTNRDQEASLLPISLSPSCYELEDVEEHEFEYIEVENKIESFQGSIGFAIFRRKN